MIVDTLVSTHRGVKLAVAKAPREADPLDYIGQPAAVARTTMSNVVVLSCFAILFDYQSHVFTPSFIYLFIHASQHTLLRCSGMERSKTHNQQNANVKRREAILNNPTSPRCVY